MGDEEATAEPPVESTESPPKAESEAPPEGPAESPPEAPVEAPPETSPEPPPEAPPDAPPETPPEAPPEAPAKTPSSVETQPPEAEPVAEKVSAIKKGSTSGTALGGESLSSSKHRVRTSTPEIVTGDEDMRKKTSSSIMEVTSKIASSVSLSRKTRSYSAAGSDKMGLNSRGKLALGSVLSIKRLDSIDEKFEKGKVARYANSYKLESDNPFNPEKVEAILESVMVELLENMTYDPINCSKQAKWAASAIRGKVKELGFDRYKLICIVTIGEKNSQDVLVATRFLWDIDRDRFAKFTLENSYVFGIAQCFGLYYE